MDKNKIHKNSSDEWYTPKSVLKAIGVKFDLDPATTKKQAIALKIKNYYTKEDDGLTKNWEGKRIWLNPPFSNKAAWVDKAISTYVNDNKKVIYILLPQALETRTHQKLLEYGALMLIPNKRIKFSGGKTPNFGCVIYKLSMYGYGNSYKILNLK